MIPSAEDNPFDPSGSGYDYESAHQAGMGRGEGGHYGSRRPDDGLMLKGVKHPTFDTAISDDNALGYVAQERDGRYYTEPNSASLTPNHGIPPDPRLGVASEDNAEDVMDFNSMSDEQIYAEIARLDTGAEGVGLLIEELGNVDEEGQVKNFASERDENAKGGLIGIGNDLSLSALGAGIGNAVAGSPAAVVGSLVARPMVDMFTGAREKGNVPEGQPHYDPKIHSVNVPGMNMDVGRPAFYVNESLRPIANAVVDAGAKGVDMIKSGAANPMFHADFP